MGETGETARVRAERNPLILRAARPADAVALGVVQAATWHAAYRNLLSEPALAAVTPAREARRLARRIERSGVVIAEVAGAVIGYVAFGPGRDCDRTDGEIEALYVLPALQGRGIGRGLIEAALLHLATQGLEPGYLWVLANNERARGFYERSGFRVDGKTRAWSCRTTPAVPYLRYVYSEQI